MFKILVWLGIGVANMSYATSLRDPTRPVGLMDGYSPATTVAITPSYRVSTIIYSTAIPKAIVNGQLVKIGDRVEDVVVKNITPNKVVLLKGDEQITIHLVNLSQAIKSQVKD